MSAVAFEAVSKLFGETVAVDDLTLQVRDGEFLVLLGPSGCGKTTALRIVAGLETATTGSVRLGERVVDDVEPAKRNVSMVFQSYALYPHMTVAKNIESPLLARKVATDDGEVRKLDAAERRERIAEVAGVLELDGLLARKPAALSGGQRQRVALARAIVSRPEAFLMDEPLSNLDAKLRIQTRAELVGLHERLGTTVLYVTHDQVEAMTMADRVAVLDAGRLQQVGPPQEVYDRPANLFVARFLGSPPMSTLALADGSIVGFRPEHARIVSPTPQSFLHGTISQIEWLGHERHVHVVVDSRHAVAGASTPSSDSVIVREPIDAVTAEVGTVVGIDVATEHRHAFDGETGIRL